MHASDSVELRVFRSLCIKVGSVLADRCLMFLDAKDYKSLADLTIDAELYSNAHEFGLDYLLVNFLSKWKGLKTGYDTRSRALSTWTGGESKCREINRIFKRELRGFSPRVEQTLFLAQRKIANVLGPAHLPTILRECKWSGGATYDCRRGTPFTQKMSDVMSVTRKALPYLKAVMESDPHWIEALTGVLPMGPTKLLATNYSVVRGNRFITVPKSAKTDRCICAEPTGNAFLQQGVHAYMRSRLLRFGVDLSKQERNKVAASQAHTFDLATLDLSSASDTISRELVFDLLPREWYFLLDDLRSHESQVDGVWLPLEKFSSMGNAFTFELETLIFWALASSVDEMADQRDILFKPLVYGDDIIIRRECYDSTVEVLVACGFTVNESKSFSSGHFFESCGGHYFDGFDVTPVYQKEMADTKQEVIRCHNRLIRWSKRTYGVPTCKEIREALSILMKFFETSFRNKHVPRIPYSCTDDDGFLSHASKLGPCDPNHGYLCHTWVVRSSFKSLRDRPFLAYKLRNPGYTSANPKGYPSSTRDLGYRDGLSYRHDWELTGA